MKQLWSGTLSKGGTVTVPDVGKYNVFAVTERYGGKDQCRMLGVSHNPGGVRVLTCSTQNDDGRDSYIHKAHFEISGTSVKLAGASRHLVSDAMTGVVTQISAIFGVL